MKISRQSEYYPTEASRQHQERAELNQRKVNFAARQNRLPSRLTSAPGIGRLGTDPLE